MKEDYLWDQTGNDADIERLEGLLSVYRYHADVPVRQNVVEFPAHRKVQNMPWLFALAAAAVLGAVGIGAWTVSIGVSDQGLAVNVEDPLAAVPPIISVPAAQPTAAAITETRLQRPLASTHKAVYKPRTNAKKREAKNLITKDEAIAYNQLLLALTITGEKLQIVKDSVNGREEKDAAAK